MNRIEELEEEVSRLKRELRASHIVLGAICEMNGGEIRIPHSLIKESDDFLFVSGDENCHLVYRISKGE